MLPHGRYNSTKPVSKFCCDIGFTIHFVVHQMSRNIFCGSKDCTKKNWVKLFVTMLKRCFEILSTPFFATAPHRFQHSNIAVTSASKRLHAQRFSKIPRNHGNLRRHRRQTVTLDTSACKKNFAGLFTSRITSFKTVLKNCSYRQGIPPMSRFLFLLFLPLSLALEKTDNHRLKTL